jgi:hypothetical protein
VIPRRLLAASLVAAFAAVAASSALTEPLPASVRDCQERIEGLRSTDAEPVARRNTETTSLPTIGDLCPEFAAALAENPWGKALAGLAPGDLETSAFVQLTTLVARYEGPPDGSGRSAAPSAAALDDALAELKLDKPAALTIWQRIQQWYDEHFGANGDEAGGWLEKWLQRFAPSQTLINYVVIVLGLVLVAATAAIVHNELRIAGVFRGAALRKYSSLAEPPASEPERPRDFADVAGAPLARRPVLLLALVVERLRARGLLASRESLTHRELLGAARLSAPQSAAFGAVLDAAERVTFADWRPDERDVDPVLARGRELLASLPAETAPK